MEHDVFISYCSENKSVADAVCAGLESDNVRCWIAPRDVPPGANWGRSIVHAITTSKIMVVIFSGHTNKSRHVVNEIERAVSHEVTIIPFRIEDVKPSEDLELFISSCHWLDALTPPLEAKIGELGRAVQRALGQTEVPDQERAHPAPAGPAVSRRGWWNTPVRVALAVLTLTLIIVAAGLLMRRGGSGESGAAATSVQLDAPPDGAVRLGPTQLVWKGDGLDKKNLEFELVITPDKANPVSHRFSRNSYALREVSGPMAWKVRPVWSGENAPDRSGPWSDERRLVYYPDALDRILATKTIHVGTAESGNIFVVNEDGEFTGFDIELLRRIGNAILRKHGREGPIKIDYTHCVWGDELFRMPQTNHAIDLLASGISITPEREAKYQLVFSASILEYPQTLVTRKGLKPFDANRFLPPTIAASANTTNEQLAQKLAATGTARFLPYEGSGTYELMFADLLAGKVDSILIDKPYVLQYLQDHWPDGNSPLTTTDILPPLVEGVEPEKVGWALRLADSRLLSEINEQLAVLAGEKSELIRKFFPQPEAFSGMVPAKKETD
jgi:ABC-type amino acid transport substrate-binding protein